MKRFLGIDHGGRRIGLALGDSQLRLASPLEVIEETDPGRQIAKVMKIISEYHVDEVVIGLPFNMDGSEGPQAKAAREFGNALQEQWKGSIRFQDERLSTFAAGELAGGAGKSKKKRRSVDAIAAQVMLQEYLDRI